MILNFIQNLCARKFEDAIRFYIKRCRWNPLLIRVVEMAVNSWVTIQSSEDTPMHSHTKEGYVHVATVRYSSAPG